MEDLLQDMQRLPKQNSRRVQSDTCGEVSDSSGDKERNFYFLLNLRSCPMLVKSSTHGAVVDRTPNMSRSWLY